MGLFGGKPKKKTRTGGRVGKMAPPPEEEEEYEEDEDGEEGSKKEERISKFKLTPMSMIQLGTAILLMLVALGLFYSSLVRWRVKANVIGGYSGYHSNRLSLAKSSLQAALKWDPSHAGARQLLAKLLAVGGDLATARETVLPGGEVALVDGALGALAALALQEELLAFAAAKPADRIDISCHVWVSSPRSRGGGFSSRRWLVSFGLYPGAPADQTRRFFGARQPLCGMGVTSLISVISKPLA